MLLAQANHTLALATLTKAVILSNYNQRWTGHVNTIVNPLNKLLASTQ